MKRFLLAFSISAFLITTPMAHAEYNTGRTTQSGRAAQSGMMQASNGWAWGIGLAGLAFLATMSGIIASSATDSPKTFSH